LKLVDLLNVESYVIIGDGLRMNAYVTPIYAMYLDGRWLGVIIGMFLYGYFTQKSFLRCKAYHNARYDAIYALLMLGLIISVVRMQFSYNAYVYGIVFTVLFIGKDVCIKRDVNR
jgi:oligosaccharide repeat unit polymerase